MTSSHHAPYAQGCKHATMAGTDGLQSPRGWSESHKAGLSSDWSLQLDSMKPELLVILDQQRQGEYVPGPCTHRPSHHESLPTPKARWPEPFGEGAVLRWGSAIGVKS